jgi:hypothetical protein
MINFFSIDWEAAMKSLKAQKAGRARVLKDVQRAKREITRLRRELKTGTKKLDTGLLKVQKYVGEIPAHVPHFKATSTGDQ